MNYKTLLGASLGMVITLQLEFVVIIMFAIDAGLFAKSFPYADTLFYTLSLLCCLVFSLAHIKTSVLFSQNIGDDNFINEEDVVSAKMQEKLPFLYSEITIGFLWRIQAELRAIEDVLCLKLLNRKKKD